MVERSREWVFDELLASLGAADPLESVLRRAARVCRGSGLVVNELGEVIRSVGAAPGHLISDWVLSADLAETAQTQIGRWVVRARAVRIRQRDHVIVIAVHEESEVGGTARESGRPGSGTVADVTLVFDTMTKILQAFEGFESFSISTHREESARLMRDLEAGVSPGNEPARWRSLEKFGFVPYQPVRIVRARTDAGVSTATRQSPAMAQGIVASDTGYTASAIEHTALCAEDFAAEDHFGAGVLRAGVSGPFTALSQVPEMLRSADVALGAADPGAFVYVDSMRPVVWAAARMSSRFDQLIVQRYLDQISRNPDSWTTLTTFIDCGANIAGTARRLQIHENTVRYRLAQIESILGSRLGEPRVMADVVIALECRRLGAGD
ncbi:MAG: helix-turn-helix domain-containing protein [Brevibacterium sp.]|nr:helix-turn-helix domain-containing protein [Brevibacterium sp.]MDN6666171.1 helix-turn-helix domain-containing protein [Brevibacterium sp.]